MNIEKIDFTEKYIAIGKCFRVKDIKRLIEIMIKNNRKGRSYNDMTPNECGYEYALNELLEKMEER